MMLFKNYEPSPLQWLAWKKRVSGPNQRKLRPRFAGVSIGKGIHSTSVTSPDSVSSTSRTHLGFLQVLTDSLVRYIVLSRPSCLNTLSTVIQKIRVHFAGRGLRSR